MNKNQAPLNKKYTSGIVVKKSSQKTAKVRVLKLIRNKILKKSYWQSSLYLVHDSQDLAQVGQEVKIVPGRKVSKKKSWQIVVNPIIDKK